VTQTDWIGKGCILAAAIVALLLGGCAARPDNPDDMKYYVETGDPLEPVNRAVFQFNEIADKVVLRPAAIGYRTVVPSGVRTGIRNFLDNLATPITVLNALLQGNGGRARDSFGRFLTNTILGLGGFIDIASDAGIPKHQEDFGQTLAVWGVGSGPYLVLPLLGPSNFRDGIGHGVDGVVDPVGRYIYNEYGMEGVGVRYTVTSIDWRANNLEAIDELRRSSLDFYAAVRSAYRQRREHEIRNGEASQDGSNQPPGVIDFDTMDLGTQSSSETPDNAQNNTK
jgi:phospholipid-binding lipoprotein MlaA